MTEDEIKTQFAEITAKVQQFDFLPENCGLIYFYCDGSRVKPCVLGNAYVLTEMLKVAARATDDFRGILADAAEELNEK